MTRLAAWLVAAYPPSLRAEYGAEIADALEQQWQAAPTARERVRVLLHLAGDCLAAWLRPRRPASARLHLANPGGGSGLPVDVRDAWRLLRRSPGFAAGAIVTLALGVGASTAILSLADATLIRPLPIPEADRVVQSAFSWSYPDFRDLVAESRTMSIVAGWGNVPFAIESGSDALQVNGAAVSGQYFTLANQRALTGRLIDASDDAPSASPAIVISERLWVRAFNRDAGVVGRVVNLNRQPVTIAGIVPAEFRGLSLQITPEVFVPLISLPELSGGFFRDPAAMNNRGRVWLIVGARLSTGASPAAASAEARRVYYGHRTAKEKEQDTSDWFTPLLSQAVGVRTATDLRKFLVLLLGASGLALLLACATVANLLLVRAEGRRAELAMRAALGAGRARLVRLLAVESLAIGLVGGVLGVGVAAGMLKVLESFALPGQIAIGDLRIGLNVEMLAASAALGCLTSLLFGLAPIRHATRAQAGLALHAAGARLTARQPMRSVLVGVQVALCVMLLGGSLAFGRAIRHALALDLGFNVTETSITGTNPSLARYSNERAADLRRRALEVLRARPDVRAAAWAMLRPMSGGFIVNPVTDGPTETPRALADVQANVVTNGYFDAMGIPVLAGRAFTPDDDANGAPTAIVSTSLARRVWRDHEAIGRRLTLDDQGPSRRWMTVVGVVGDIHRAVGGPAVPMLYVPVGTAPPAFTPDYLFVRSTTSGAAALPEIRAVLRRLDPSLPISSSVPMTSHVSAPLMAHRLGLTLFLLFSGLAAALTVLGVYSVVAAAIAQRRREIGIRVALGAEAGRVVRLVVRQGMVAVAIGLAAGLAASAASARLIESFLFSLAALSAGTTGAIVAAIVVIAALGMLIPARRALAIDPVAVLRAE